MKRLLIILMLTLCAPVLAQTQMELNQQAKAEFDKADAELNQVWGELKKQVSPDTREKLIDAQLLWIKYRDAEAEARASLYKGGSIAPMVFHNSRTEVTKARINILLQWMEEFSF